MSCANCAKSRIYAERQVDAHFTYNETLVSQGTEQRICYKARNRRVVRAFSDSPFARLSWTPDQVTFVAPAGIEAVVEFSIGR